MPIPTLLLPRSSSCLQSPSGGALHLEKGQKSSWKEITDESANRATGGKNLSKRLACLKRRIRINAGNLIILLGRAAAVPDLDCHVLFWSVFVQRDTTDAEGERRRAVKACGSAPGRSIKAANCSVNRFSYSKDN